MGSAIANRYVGSRAPTRTKKSVDYGGITTQYDKHQLYRKKFMPKRKKRAWKKFAKKVQAVEIADRGLVTHILHFDRVQTVAASAQAFQACHLYGWSGTNGLANEIGPRDMKGIFERNYLLRKTVYDSANDNVLKADGGNDWLNVIDEVRMQSAILDVVMQNTGNVTLVVDMYHLWYTEETDQATLSQVIINGAAETQPIQTTGGALPVGGITTLGVSLFDIGKSLSQGIKVMKVKQFLLGPSQVVTEQIRDAKNWKLNPYKCVRESNQFTNPTVTESLLFVAKNVNATTEGSIRYSATRHYRFTVEGNPHILQSYENSS